MPVIDVAVKVDEYGAPIWDFSDLEWFLKMRYRCGLNDIEITDTPGYWQMKEFCKGAGYCKHPIHRTIGNDSGTKHTIQYLDDNRDQSGRFVSRYRTWHLWRKIEAAK